MKIAFFEVKGWERPYLSKQLKGHTCQFFEGPLNKNNVKKIKNVDAIGVFIKSQVDKSIIDSLPNLKLITTLSTGFDHVDVEYAKLKQIVVTNVPFYGENTVAEHAFGLLLSISRNIYKAYVRTTAHNFTLEGLKGFDLKGKQLGVVGGGHIGMHLVRMAKSFGMKVVVFDLRQDNFLAETLGFEYVTMNTLLKTSDVISLHVPYNKHTHHLIDKAAFKKMKKGSVLINTARGGIVDTKALLWALETNILQGAGLDVLEDELIIGEEKELLHGKAHQEEMKRLAVDWKLLEHPDVVYTPHMAFFSEEALYRILDETVQNILNYKKGCKNIVS